MPIIKTLPQYAHDAIEIAIGEVADNNMLSASHSQVNNQICYTPNLCLSSYQLE